MVIICCFNGIRQALTEYLLTTFDCFLRFRSEENIQICTHVHARTRARFIKCMVHHNGRTHARTSNWCIIIWFSHNISYRSCLMFVILVNFVCVNFIFNSICIWNVVEFLSRIQRNDMIVFCFCIVFHT